MLSVVIIPSALAGGDAEHGKTLFGRCAPCHATTTQSKAGPGLALWLDDMPLAVVADVDTMSPNLVLTISTARSR
jgi:cytochrome c2